MADAITGTPLYIAPETLTAPDSVDGRADLYALGAVGYRLLTGTHVFDGATIVEVCAHHLHTQAEPPSTRTGAPISPDLEALLLDCLAKRPADRPPSAHALRDRLRACTKAGTWTNARAAEWWARHRPELQTRHQETSATPSGPALTVTRFAD